MGKSKGQDWLPTSRPPSPQQVAAAAAQWPQHVVSSFQSNVQQTLQTLRRALQRPRHSHTPVSWIPSELPALLASVTPAAAAAAAAAPASSASSSSGLVTKEEVGRATWMFLHTLAAQYPDKPTRQQQQDVRNLIDILTRMYPCAECAAHFKQLVAAAPPQVGSPLALQLWMCEAHNSVNRRLGKPSFNCALVQARWSGLDCGEDQGCSLQLGSRRTKE